MNTTLSPNYERLLERLIAFFPELASDEEFITGRCAAADRVFDDQIMQGEHAFSAQAACDEVLFSNLYFSRFATITEALNELYPSISYEEARRVALELLDRCTSVFDRYEIDDYFETSATYENELLPALMQTIQQINPQIN